VATTTYVDAIWFSPGFATVDKQFDELLLFDCLVSPALQQLPILYTAAPTV